MAKRDKGKSAKFDFEENESGPLDSKPLVELGSSSDEEANEDLSLKIVEKALSVKAARLSEIEDEASDDRDVVPVVDLPSSSSQGGSDVTGTSGGGEEIDLNLINEKIVKRRGKKKMKIEKAIAVEDGDKAKIMEKAETVEEAAIKMAKDGEAVESLDPKTVDISDNVVLRKLLRGPRYFDPPDSGWGTCYNCGEEGHMAVNCKSASKRRKPCFLCGSLDHGVRQCSEAQDCFICKKSGHRAKECPDKHKSGIKYGNFCLRCGASGHDMFTCRNDYSGDDLKEIQCYVCKNFGHLCCVNFVDTSSSEASCYRCGQQGHTGLSCGNSRRQNKETTDSGSPSLCYKCGGGHFARECVTATTLSSSCYKCGEGGHFARECVIATTPSSSCYKCGEGGHFARECSSAKVGKRNRESSTPNIGKRNRESSTPNVRPRREHKGFLGHKSAPCDQCKSPQRKKFQYEEEGYSTPRKAKQRGGWIAEDPRDFSNKKSKKNHWNSPSTTSNEARKKKASSSGGHILGHQSSNRNNSHRFSASRFGNFGNDGTKRTYDWW